MLLSVTTQYAKFGDLFNALRISWLSAQLSKAYCQELLNFLSLAELLGFLSRQSLNLQRTHAHLTQGTCPSKKLTNIKDVKRYHNVTTIAC